MTSSGARHVGNIASLITGVVAEVAREIGEFVTDAIEMNEAAAAARRDAEQQREAERDYREAVDLDADDDVEVTTAVFTETPIAEPAEPAPGEKA
ncbi:hypothetical protein [Nocardia asteroides]|uniref:hypothetical protein n=1 Tax=Nocardia asteroides TaxID=1824 RepID=UPI0018DCC90E|nr:hypothetical protein [Nocardia asteroides]UGT47256.1 hypothetical protein LT345_22435 [Nocardia asteroides]